MLSMDNEYLRIEKLYTNRGIIEVVYVKIE